MNRSIRCLTTTVALGAVVLGLAAGCSRQQLNAPETEPVFEGNAATFSAVFDGHLTRVDRMGMPAIATAVISSKDAYNMADPVDDAAGTFVSEIVASIDFLHGALDDDLTAAGLTPCATGDCVNQAAPLVVPDVIRIDPAAAPGFPNGRRLTDPVIDVTLALVLLDLGSHPVTALVGVNPTANDRSFKRGFPFLAKPHR